MAKKALLLAVILLVGYALFGNSAPTHAQEDVSYSIADACVSLDDGQESYTHAEMVQGDLDFTTVPMGDETVTKLSLEALYPGSTIVSFDSAFVIVFDGNCVKALVPEGQDESSQLATFDLVWLTLGEAVDAQPEAVVPHDEECTMEVSETFDADAMVAAEGEGLWSDAPYGGVHFEDYTEVTSVFVMNYSVPETFSGCILVTISDTDTIMLHVGEPVEIVPEVAIASFANRGTMNIGSDGGFCEIGFFSSNGEFSIDFDIADGQSAVFDGGGEFNLTFNGDVWDYIPTTGVKFVVNGPMTVTGSVSSTTVCVGMTGEVEGRLGELDSHTLITPRVLRTGGGG